jgi:serine/threonine protein kinase
MIGKTISHYKILEELGRGGMGTVYKAHDLKLDRFVALKFLDMHLGASKQQKQRFIHEAKAASSLDHSNICTIHEIDETKTAPGEPGEGQMFIVMACYEGESLQEKINNQKLKTRDALDFAIQIARGIARAHEANIVHRDLKPANIMITDRNEIKIVDFGLAKLSSQTKLTKDGSTMGTVSYMSPEQTRGEAVDYRTDIWALGIILYEMYTGESPFKGDYDQAIIYSILNEDPVLPEDIPSELEQILKKSLAKDPAMRYQSMNEMVVDIEQAQKNMESGKMDSDQIKQKTQTKRQESDLISDKIKGKRSILQRLSDRSMGTFVGREKEIDMLLNAFSRPELPFFVAYIHGPGGIGKSFLIQSLISRITDSGGHVAFLDCRETEPTINGFLSGLCEAFGLQDEQPDLNDMLLHISKNTDRTLICLDQYENFILMDTWLRQVFIPALPDTTLTVMASRYAPKTSWLTKAGWQDLFREIELKEFSEEESTQMLRTRNLDKGQIERVKQFAHGYPLVLELGAAALRSQPDLNVHFGPPAKIITQLSRVLLSDLSQEKMEAVKAMSTVRWATEPILRALLNLNHAQTIFNELEELSFVYPTQEGLILHEVFQEAVSRDLSSRDPERYNFYRSRAWRFFSKESQKAREHHLWHLTADMLYLIENPVVREAFFPKGSSEYFLQPAIGEDYEEIVEIARNEETKEAAELVEKWLNHHPECFFVAKGSETKVAGFYFCFEPHKVDEKILSHDPLTKVWLKHLRQNPVKPEERVLFLRRWLARITGESFSPVQGACWVDIKRTYMEMRPRLRRLYTTVNDLAAYAPVVIPLCFSPIDDAHVGRMYHSALLDFGEGSVDGWLKSLVKAELGVDSTDI